MMQLSPYSRNVPKFEARVMVSRELGRAAMPSCVVYPKLDQKPCGRAFMATSPDRAKLFPLVDKLLRRYLADRSLAKLPATLDAYLRTVVTATLEAERQGGCVAVKFEAAYLRALDFD